MKKIKHLLLFAHLLMMPMHSLFSQTVNGTVYSVLNLGSLDYSYIVDETDGVFYKTGAYATGLLVLNSPVTLVIDPNNTNEFNVEVRNSNQVVTAYATKLVRESFQLPTTSVYGMPVLENEILFFQNQSHFDEFYAILNDFSTSPWEERIDLLQLFENQYPGFTSFSKMLIDDYNWEEGEFSETQLDQRHHIDYFHDYVIKYM